jgi:hypothetical protein
VAFGDLTSVMANTVRAAKYLITLWKDCFDIDGLTNDFAIVAEYGCFDDAKSQLKPLANDLIAKELFENPTWFPMDNHQANEKSRWYNVNNRRVLARESFKVGDGTGFNHTYGYLEVIGISEGEPVNETLFNLKDCGFEVGRFFDGQKFTQKNK